MSVHGDKVAHLTGVHGFCADAGCCGLATHSSGWLDLLHDGIHQAEGIPVFHGTEETCPR